MMNLKKIILGTGLACLIGPPLHAQPASNVLGQTIHINTQLKKVTGKATWLLIIRDLDNGMNLPYMFDFTTGYNGWLAFSYGRNYTILVSQLTIVKFQPQYNTARKFVTNNFCNLQSNGRILRGKSLYVTIKGRLTPNRDTYNCNISSYSDDNLYIGE